MNWAFRGLPRGSLCVREAPPVSVLGDLMFPGEASEGFCYSPLRLIELPSYGYWGHGLLAKGVEDLCVEFVTALLGASAPPCSE
jgi:hypothetical protein